MVIMRFSRKGLKFLLGERGKKGIGLLFVAHVLAD